MMPIHRHTVRSATSGVRTFEPPRTPGRGGSLWPPVLPCDPPIVRPNDRSDEPLHPLIACPHGCSEGPPCPLLLGTCHPGRFLFGTTLPGNERFFRRQNDKWDRRHPEKRGWATT